MFTSGETSPKNAGAYYVLTADIDCAGQSVSDYGSNAHATAWTDYGNGFAGTIDGRGYALNNLEYKTSETNHWRVQGLFGGLINATIKNITFNLSTFGDNGNLGLFGWNIKNSTISNVTINIPRSYATTMTQGGFFARQQCDGTYKDITVNAPGTTILYLMGSGGQAAVASTTNIKVYAAGVTYIYSSTTEKEGITVYTNIAPTATLTATPEGTGSYTGKDKLTDGVAHVSFPWDNTCWACTSNGTVTMEFASEITLNAIGINTLIPGSGVAKPKLTVYYADANGDWQSLGELTVPDGVTQYYAYSTYSGISTSKIKIEIEKTSYMWSIDEVEVYALQVVGAYTITFQNYDGTVLQSSQVDYGVTPSYTGETPTRPADAQYTYSFKGWDKEVVAVTGDATYTATYNETLNKYNITFQNYDGTVLQNSQVDYGTTPSYTGATPTKPASEGKTYTFNGWDKEIVAVTEDAIYTAVYEEIKDLYTITFKNYDETVLQSSQVAYGEMPTYTGTTPTKPSESKTVKYKFAGWDNQLEIVTSDAEYIAVFEESNYANIALNSKTITITSSSYGTNDSEVLNDEVISTPDNIPYWGSSAKCYANNVDSEIIFDLGESYTISDLYIHGICSSDGVRIPKSMTISYSDDNISYLNATFTVTYYDEDTNEALNYLDTLNTTFYSGFSLTEFTGRYIKLSIVVSGAFSFDEIELYTPAYKITFNNPDGTLISEEFVAQGKLPVCSQTPTYDNNSSYINIFSGWNTTIKEATSNSTYIAQYKKITASNISNITTISSDYSGVGSLNAPVEKIIDGVTSSNWGDGTYFGQTNVTSFTFDLGTERYWGFLRIHYVFESGSGLVMPTFTVYSSNDDNIWSKVATFTDNTITEAGYYWMEDSVPTTYSRYIKIVVSKSGYMFGLDEIEIYGYCEYGTNIASEATVTAPDGFSTEYYSLNGKDKLTDNKYYNTIKYDFSDDQYGVNGSVDIVFSFNEAVRYNVIRVHGPYIDGDGARLPASIKAYKSADNENWEFVKELNVVAKVDGSNTYYWAEANFDWEESQYIKIVFVSSGVVSVVDEIQIFGESEELPESDIDRTLEKVAISDYCSYTLNGTIYSGYEDTDDGILTGIVGSGLSYVGFYANQEVSIVVDLGNSYDLASFKLSAKKDTSIGAVFPNYITIYTSIDKNTWVKAGLVYASTTNTTYNDYILELYFKVNARYVKFVTSSTSGTCYLIERVTIYSYMSDYQGIYPALNLPTVTEDESWGSTSTSSVNFVSGKTPWITVPGNAKVYPDGKNDYASNGLLTDGATVSSWSSSKGNIYNGKYFKIYEWQNRNIYFDFGYLSSIKQIKVGLLKATGAGVYAPNMTIALSTDGLTWYNVGTIDYSNASNNTINRYSLNLSSYVQARFICIKFNVDQWVGIDEIQVYGTKKLQGQKVTEAGYSTIDLEYHGDYSEVSVSSDLLKGASDIYLSGQMNTAINIYYMPATFDRLLSDGGWKNGYLGKQIYDATYKYVKGILTESDLKPDTITIAQQNCVVDQSKTFKFIDNSRHLYSVKLYESPIHGTVTINDDGTITYYADDDFIGSVTFTVVYSEHFAYSDPITITMVISS